jgi:phospholipid/cholesterol/gamma-HCH transport system substrate-binding protein
MPNRGSRVNPAVVGLIAAVIMFGLLFFAFGKVSLFTPTLDVKAQVATGDTLAPNADVAVAGVKVGTVKSIEKGDPGALIDMSVDSREVSVYQNASIKIRPHGVFGPKFVELDPGSTSAGSFADGGTIPIANTRISVDFEQVLNSLNPDTRVSLQTFFQEFGTAADKRGGDFGQFLDSLGTVETQLTPVLQVIDNRSANVGRLFESNATMSETFANSPFDQIISKNGDAFGKLDATNQPLTGVIIHGNRVLTALDSITGGSNTQALTAAVAKLPSLFDNLQRFNNDLGYGINAISPAILPQRGQVDSDVALAVKRAQDVFGQCDITDQTDPADPRGLSDTVHANFVRIVPCYGADGKPYRDGAGHVAHHHVDVVAGTHNHPLANTLIAPTVIDLQLYAFDDSFRDHLLGDNEGSVLCGPNSGNSTRPTNPAFTCLHSSQSDPLPGHGTAPPPLFSALAAQAATAAAPEPSASASLAALGRAVSHAVWGRPLAQHFSPPLDLVVALALITAAAGVGFGFWRTRRRT